MRIHFPVGMPAQRTRGTFVIAPQPKQFSIREGTGLWNQRDTGLNPCSSTFQLCDPEQVVEAL